jgi:hypothetical protein
MREEVRRMWRAAQKKGVGWKEEMNEKRKEKQMQTDVSLLHSLIESRLVARLQ